LCPAALEERAGGYRLQRLPAVDATRGPRNIAETRDDAEVREREDEIARYRRAAEETLGQLAWCVNYLHRIRKGRIAELIDANCRHIRREMSGAGS
jgi:hypothetical protein